MAQEENFNHIVRVSSTDLDGNKQVLMALQKIKGVGFMFSNMMCNLMSIETSKKAGYLTDAELKKLEDFLAEPAKFGAPEWMFNRRLDPETGEHKHVFGADLKFQQQNDIKLMRKLKSYKGVRHASGLPVRGQKTRSNFRKNKGKVAGVKRKGKK